jgi:SOS-response transcriptional repressor LexA
MATAASEQASSHVEKIRDYQRGIRELRDKEYASPVGKIRLQPASSDMAPIIVPAADVKIQGRVVGVLRKY